MIIGGTVAGIALVLAAAVFAYELYLKGDRDRKAENLAQAQRAVDLDTVEDFIRLRDRLNAVESLLDQHVELSGFFDILEEKTLQTVRFSSLNVTVANDRSAEIDMEGVARSFNALAAQSAAFASERRIKRAIFSDIAVNDNGTVGFTLTATVDPRLITSAALLPGMAEETPAVRTNLPVAPTPTLPSATTSRATTTPRAATTTPSL